MTEFSIIQDYCYGIGPDHKETVLGIGDDAAIVAIPDGMELALSVDSMVSGIHFFADAKPAFLAHKLLAVNLSDMAAMGAEPKWATLAISLPELNESWISEFSKSLKQMAQRYKLQIIGGDTSQGPLNLTLNIMGLLPKGKMISRHGAKPGDDVYVSNVIGDAALGLQCLQGEYNPNSEIRSSLISALEQPTPRVDLGMALIDVASACIDLSDGLIGDLMHICERAQVGIELDVDQLPLSPAYLDYLDSGGSLNPALTGGDDYELSFCAATHQRQQIEQIAERCDIAITRIGKVHEAVDKKVSLKRSGGAYTLPNAKSFEHFA